MEGLISPDVPAILCYWVVLFIGILTSRAVIVDKLTAIIGRWGYADTWLLFVIQTLVPVLLFWVLDRARVINDTSIFAAILVGGAYRQILAGQMKNVTAPGQIASIWQPIEVWRNNVVNRVSAKNTVRLDDFEREVTRYVASNAALVTKLSNLVRAHSIDATLPSVAESDPVKKERSIRLHLKELRLTEPTRFDRLLCKEKLVPGRAPWSKLPFVRGRWIGLFGIVFMMGMLWTVQQFGISHPSFVEFYDRWRLTKPNATARERLRVRNMWLSRFEVASFDPQRLLPCVRELALRDIDEAVVTEILILSRRSPLRLKRAFWCPQLATVILDAAPTTRSRLHGTLLAIVEQVFPEFIEKEAEKWKVLKDWKNPADELPETGSVLGEAWRSWLTNADSSTKGTSQTEVGATSRSAAETFSPEADESAPK